jgi:hypothetical protein
MAEMRLRSGHWILLAILVLLALPAVAGADIQPIPKPPPPPATPPSPPATPPSPPATPPTPPATPPTPPATPPATPPTPPATPPTPPATPPTPPATPPTGTGTNTPETIIVLVAEGGRDQSGVVAVVPPPDPTPLAVVAVGDVIPSEGSSTPIWKIAVLALLAAGEAFLIVRLVRHRAAPVAPA